MSGTSDKSCGAKSVSTPSTPQAETVNNLESRHSHSLPAQSSPADLISVAREDKEFYEDSLLGQETPLVCYWLLFFSYCSFWEKCRFVWHIWFCLFWENNCLELFIIICFGKKLINTNTNLASEKSHISDFAKTQLSNLCQKSILCF